ncbi:MAG: hypothetical protein AAFV29_25110, partial [Myxococcota bacterium]
MGLQASKSKRFDAPVTPTEQAKKLSGASKLSSSSNKSTKVPTSRDQVEVGGLGVNHALKMPPPESRGAELGEAPKLKLSDGLDMSSQTGWKTKSRSLQNAPSSVRNTPESRGVSLDKPAEKEQFFVRTLQGLRTLDRSDDLTAADIKKQLGVDPDQYNIWFGGHKLEGRQTLKDLNIHADSTLDALPRLRGGHDGDGEPTDQPQTNRERAQRGRMPRVRFERPRELDEQPRVHRRPTQRGQAMHR